MKIEEHHNLQPYNTFAVPARTRYFAEVNSIEELQDLMRYEVVDEARGSILILGGGSNVLFTKDFDGLVIKNNITGKEIVEEDERSITFRVYSGENWHNLVLWATDNGYSGIENLALIPGSVGAAPVQNIGAYGVELRDVIRSVGTVEIETGEVVNFSEDGCHFGYRDSYFKNEGKGKYFITDIVITLSKEDDPVTEYRSLNRYLEEEGITNPTKTDVREAVIAIRRAKLPQPEDIGNAGSFFKNPYVDFGKLKQLQENYPDIPFFETENGYKIPSAWLIEQLGWKGYRENDAGVHDKQPLVLVNHGNATGEEIKALSEKIQESVENEFSITLEPEVTIL